MLTLVGNKKRHVASSSCLRKEKEEKKENKQTKKLICRLPTQIQTLFMSFLNLDDLHNGVACCHREWRDLVRDHPSCHCEHVVWKIPGHMRDKTQICSILNRLIRTGTRSLTMECYHQQTIGRSAGKKTDRLTLMDTTLSCLQSLTAFHWTLPDHHHDNMEDLFLHRLSPSSLTSLQLAYIHNEDIILLKQFVHLTQLKIEDMDTDSDDNVIHFRALDKAIRCMPKLKKLTVPLFLDSEEEDADDHLLLNQFLMGLCRNQPRLEELRFRDFPEIHSYSINCLCVNDNFRILTLFRQLHTLDISSCAIFIGHLAYLSGMTALTTLHLSPKYFIEIPEITDQDPIQRHQWVAVIQRNRPPALKHLHLDNVLDSVDESEVGYIKWSDYQFECLKLETLSWYESGHLRKSSGFAMILFNRLQACTSRNGFSRISISANYIEEPNWFLEQAFALCVPQLELINCLSRKLMCRNLLDFPFEDVVSSEFKLKLTVNSDIQVLKLFDLDFMGTDFLQQMRGHFPCLHSLSLYEPARDESLFQPSIFQPPNVLDHILDRKHFPDLKIVHVNKGRTVPYEP